jgi:hypothetical protein
MLPSFASNLRAYGVESRWLLYYSHGHVCCSIKKEQMYCRSPSEIKHVYQIIELALFVNIHCWITRTRTTTVVSLVALSLSLISDSFIFDL